jgi:hypothetical protein
MGTMFQESPSWDIVVGRRLYDQERRPVGQIVGLFQKAPDDEQYARVVLKGIPQDELLVPVSYIGILSEDWAMMDRTIDDLQDDELEW